MNTCRFCDVVMVAAIVVGSAAGARGQDVSFSLAGDPNLGAGNPVAVFTSPADGTPPTPFFVDNDMYFPGDDLDALTASKSPPLDKIVTPQHPFGTYTVLYSIKDGHSGTIESYAGEEIWKVSALDADRRTLLVDTLLGIGPADDVDGFDHRAPPGLVFTEYSVGNGSPPPIPNPPPGPDTNDLFDRNNPGTMLNQTVDYPVDIAIAVGPFVDNIRAWTRGIRTDPRAGDTEPAGDGSDRDHRQKEEEGNLRVGQPEGRATYGVGNLWVAWNFSLRGKLRVSE